MDQSKLAEYKAIVNKGGSKEIRADLANLESELERTNRHKKRLAELEKEIEGIPGQAEKLAESGGSVLEAENLGRRLNELSAQRTIQVTIVATAEKRLEAAWGSFEKMFKDWRANESKKVIDAGLAQFVDGANRAANLLTGLIASLKEQEGKLEGISLPGDLARLRGVRMAAELAGGVLLAAQNKPGLIKLPIANTGTESLRLHGRVRTIREATPDPRAPMILEASAWLGLLSVELPAARRPFSKSSPAEDKLEPAGQVETVG